MPSAVIFFEPDPFRGSRLQVDARVGAAGYRAAARASTRPIQLDSVDATSPGSTRPNDETAYSLEPRTR